jgi:hypothetical protein
MEDDGAACASQPFEGIVVAAFISSSGLLWDNPQI